MWRIPVSPDSSEMVRTRRRTVRCGVHSASSCWQQRLSTMKCIELDCPETSQCTCILHIHSINYMPTPDDFLYSNLSPRGAVPPTYRRRPSPPCTGYFSKILSISFNSAAVRTVLPAATFSRVRSTFLHPSSYKTSLA